MSILNDGGAQKYRTMESMIFHIPHASTTIPGDIQSQFVLDDETLSIEILKMTDFYTDELFYEAADQDDVVVKYPVSRLVVDPERFREDDQEIMANRGMGVIYTKTHDGSVLRRDLSRFERKSLIERFYDPHHNRLTELVAESLKRNGKALIVDCHSFPSIPSPYESNQNPSRPQICIGTDPYHTPESIVNSLINSFENLGYTVARNHPFAGALVPIQFYQEQANVRAVMIELNRELYMDEATGERGHLYHKMKSDIRVVIQELREVLGA
jgi:N-formylglutamate deformylase